MTIILLVLALVLNLIAIALMIVTYQTIRDAWDKITDIERRLRKLERGRDGW